MLMAFIITSVTIKCTGPPSSYLSIHETKLNNPLYDPFLTRFGNIGMASLCKVGRRQT